MRPGVVDASSDRRARRRPVDRRGQMKTPENRNVIARPRGVTRRQALAGLASASALTAFGGGAAFAAKPLKVAAVFATPIEEPWDHQIHVALLKAKQELGIEYKWSEH